MLFIGSKFCPHCGSVAARWESEGEARLCPACKIPLLRGQIAATALDECSKCFGIWLDRTTFEQICRDSEAQAAVLGSPCAANSGGSLQPVRYVPCPHCRELMQRVNFAKCSGVVVDVCREHGTWFDMNELHRIVQFIRSGGLDKARDVERVKLAEERRRLESTRRAAGSFDPGPSYQGYSDGSFDQGDLVVLVAQAAGALLSEWFNSR